MLDPDIYQDILKQDSLYLLKCDGASSLYSQTR
jgi:hypothetical protein